MGFFVSDEVAAARPKIKPVKILHAPGCDGCILKAAWPQMLSPKMPILLPPGGVQDAEILVLGQYPSFEDDRAGIPFSKKCPDGQKLLDHIPQRHMDRIAWQSAVRCGVPGGGAPSNAEVHSCSIHLRGDLDALPRLRAIVGVGGIPLSVFAPSFRITDVHGMRFPIQTANGPVWYYPVLHPQWVSDIAGKRDFDFSPAYPLFKNDLTRFFKEFDHWPDPYIYDLNPEKVVQIYSEDDARGYIERMEGALGFDIETSCLRPYENNARILTAAFSDGINTIAFPVEHPECVTSWGWKLIEETVRKRRIIAHSAGMEISWLWWRMGIDWFPDNFEDTMAMGRIMHARESSQSLEAISVLHLGTNVKKLSSVDTKHIMSYTLAEVLPYNGLDAQACKLIFHEFLEKMNKVEERQYQVLLDTVRSCVAMELSGLPVDEKVNTDLHTEYTEKVSNVLRAARGIYEVQAFERKYGKAFNIGSPQDVSKALMEFGKVDLKQSKSGKNYSTDDEDLERIAKTNPLAALVQDYRGHTKLLGTYIEPLMKKNLMTDGLLHPRYKTTFTKTLRLSSEWPNIQNFPKHKDRFVRKQINADIKYLGWNLKQFPIEDAPHILVAIDSGQIQARVLAMMTKDRKLCEAIITGYDIHSDWRDRLLKTFPDYMVHVEHKTGETEKAKLMKAARGEIKQDFVFSSMFGAGPASCAERINAPLHIMVDLQADFFQEFSGVKRWIKKMRKDYQETGTTYSPTAQRRYAILTGNEPLNNPIQSGERDIMIESQNALCDLALKTGDYYLMPRINIHDDLTFIMPDNDRLLERINIVADEMVRLRFEWIIVPLMVEISIGNNWCDLEEIAKITGEYHK